MPGAGIVNAFRYSRDGAGPPVGGDDSRTAVELAAFDRIGGAQGDRYGPMRPRGFGPFEIGLPLPLPRGR